MLTKGFPGLISRQLSQVRWVSCQLMWEYITYITPSLIVWDRSHTTHKGQWHGTLMLSLICAWINGWVNNRKAGDLRRNRIHYDAIVMNNVIYIHQKYHLPKQVPQSWNPTIVSWTDVSWFVFTKRNQKRTRLTPWHDDVMNSFHIACSLCGETTHHKGPVMWIFDISFVVHLNKLFNKESSFGNLKHIYAHLTVMHRQNLRHEWILIMMFALGFLSSLLLPTWINFILTVDK